MLSLWLGRMDGDERCSMTLDRCGQSQAREHNYDLPAVLVEQTLTLLTGKFGVRPPTAVMQQAIADLESLLRNRCEEEARYQELLEQYPVVSRGSAYTHRTSHEPRRP